jgi:hypothetical protein
MSAIQSGAPTAEAAFGRDPWLYACPECGELPRACVCLRRSVRDRIANSIHFPLERRDSEPFLVMRGEAELPPPSQGGLPPAA